MPSTTRGPLPPAIYWRRRLVLLSVALVLVLAIGKVLSFGSDGSGSGSATQAGATSRTSFPPPDTTAKAGTKGATKGSATSGRSGKGGQRGHGGGATDQPSPSVVATPTPTPTVVSSPTLADPTGPCPDDDVYITPTVTDGVAGSPVTITLNLQTQKSAACTWQVTPKTVAVKITSGADTVWTSQECPKVIPTQEVVVRSTVATQVPMTWDAKRSDEYCSGRTAKVLPGYYHVFAAPLGGEPTDVQFQLTAPVAPQVTVTVTPTPTVTSTPTPTPSASTGGGKGKHHPKND